MNQCFNGVVDKAGVGVRDATGGGGGGGGGVNGRRGPDRGGINRQT